MDNTDAAAQRAQQEIKHGQGAANDTHTWQNEVRQKYEAERTRAEKEASEKK